MKRAFQCLTACPTRINCVPVQKYNLQIYTGIQYTEMFSITIFNSYLFWTDQGLKTISRSRPDGSLQEVIVTENVALPNQITVYRRWVNSWVYSETSLSFKVIHI